MLFRQLEYFVALAREKHFARAAAACYVSQPTLSEAIRKLEHELDVPLVRRGRAFEGLTPEGERLVARARRLLADHDALKDEAASLRTGLTGELRLGVVPAAAGTVALLSDPFCADHPLASVRLETSLRSAEIAQRIRAFELDAGLVHPDGLDTEGLAVLPLYEERQVLVAGSDLLPDPPERLDWADAAELPLCLLSSGMQGRQVVDDAFAARGLGAVPRLEADSVVTLMAHVGTGCWASILPSSWLRTLPPPPGARVVALDGPATTATVALVIGGGPSASLMARALAGTARAVRVTGPLAQLSNPGPGQGEP
ncbi:LysR family transcriptional regulator [Sinomonas halotolerans]|uniref:LysR family transcriptional regulator n=1 Tax=Sinomonas halotolerans TaxID=1644133 RepID=A0ABU9X2S2_9MICC